jgi:predicted transcriptional regulator of viral defense system
VLADVVWDPCYATGWTAANHWGLTEQTFRTTVIKTAARVRRSAQRLLDNDYLLSHTGLESMAWGIRREWREQRRIKIADPARTVIDVLDDPRLGAGIRLAGEILSAYLEEHSPDTLVSYGDRLGNGTVFKRMGLLAERLGTDPELMTACEQRLPSGFPLLDPTQPASGPRSQRWRLRINASVAEMGPS